LFTIINYEFMHSNLSIQASNWVFVGCMFIGIALGIYYNAVAIGTLAGMGVGFIARGFTNINSEKESDKKNSKY